MGDFQLLPALWGKIEDNHDLQTEIEFKIQSGSMRGQASNVALIYSLGNYLPKRKGVSAYVSDVYAYISDSANRPENECFIGTSLV